MNKKWKMTGFMVLLLVMIFPLTVSGTGGKEPVTAEAMEIHWMMRIKSGEETAWWKQEVEEKLNVRIIPNGIDTNDKEKASVMLAAGEFPDCGSTPAALGSVYDLYNEGVTRGIPEDMIRKYAPSYSRTLDADFPVGWLMYRNKDNDKEFVSLTGVHIANDTYGFAPGFRVDWAKNVGFELPNYEQKKIPLDRFNKTFLYYEDVTLEWLERLLKAFKNGDPDGNGKIDTIPWGGSNGFGSTWRTIVGAFGVSEGFNVMVDGKLYEWCISPGYKDFLKLAARWYREGLLDKEFATIDYKKAWEKIATQQVGAAVVCTDYAGADYAKDRPPNSWVKDEELTAGAQVVLLAPPIGPTGKRGSRVWSPVSPLSYTSMVGKQVSDEKLAKILEIQDYSKFSTLENFVYDRWGKPGVHFDWEGTPWESSPIGRKYEDVPAGYPKEGGGGGGVYPGWVTMERMKFIYPKHLFDYYENFLTAEIGQKMTIRPYKYDLFAETNLTELNKKYNDTLNTIRDEFQLGVITGEIDLDAEWDSYVAKYRKNGGDEIIAEYMKAPIVSELRKGKTVY